MTKSDSARLAFSQVLDHINQVLNEVSGKAGKDNLILYNKYEKLKALHRTAAQEMNKGNAANLKRVQFIVNLIVSDLEKDLPPSAKE